MFSTKQVGSTLGRSTLAESTSAGSKLAGSKSAGSKLAANTADWNTLAGSTSNGVRRLRALSVLLHHKNFIMYFICTYNNILVSFSDIDIL